MQKILSDFCSEKRMISIYTNDRDTDKFHFGTILAVNEREIAIHMLSPDGDDDGIIVMDVNKVFRIEENGQYAEKMKKLCSAKSIPAYNFNMIGEDIKRSVLSYACQQKRIVSVELLDSGYNDIVGFIETIDDGMCKIRQVDAYGYEDGFSYIDDADITILTVLSQDEKRIQKLWELNQ